VATYVPCKQCGGGGKYPVTSQFQCSKCVGSGAEPYEKPIKPVEEQPFWRGPQPGKPFSMDGSAVNSSPVPNSPVAPPSPSYVEYWKAIIAAIEGPAKAHWNDMYVDAKLNVLFGPVPKPPPKTKIRSEEDKILPQPLKPSTLRRKLRRPDAEYDR
jgi:hypothetical protein